MERKITWSTLAIVLVSLVGSMLYEAGFVSGVKTGLVVLTVIAHVFLLVFLVLMLMESKLYFEILKEGRALAFIVATTATLGSLFYSEIAGYYPCKFCWFQRIFMYPLALLLGIAVWKRDDIRRYVKPMAIIGGLFAFWHYLTQLKGVSTSCAAFEGAADCASKFFFHLDYITIPLMALTAFLLITIFMYLKPEE